MARIAPGLRTHRTRAERMVGWFVGAATIGLILGFVAYVYYTAKRKGKFEPRAVYQTSIANAAGLKVGDSIKMMGFDVGEITAVIPNDPYAYYNVTIEFFVRQGDAYRYFDYILTDSTAKIASADLFGARFIEIQKGSYGLKTVWQPDPKKKELRRLDRDKVEGFQAANKETLIKYRKWDSIRKLPAKAVFATGIDTNLWANWSTSRGSFFTNAAKAQVEKAWWQSESYRRWKFLKDTKVDKLEPNAVPEDKAAIEEERERLLGMWKEVKESEYSAAIGRQADEILYRMILENEESWTKPGIIIEGPGQSSREDVSTLRRKWEAVRALPPNIVRTIGVDAKLWTNWAASAKSFATNAAAFEIEREWRKTVSYRQWLLVSSRTAKPDQELGFDSNEKAKLVGLWAKLGKGKPATLLQEVLRLGEEMSHADEILLKLMIKEEGKWNNSDPFVGHLADALDPEQLKVLYPGNAALKSAVGASAEGVSKPYFLDPIESPALGDVVTQVADQISGVVGKPGAIGDLVINDDIRKLFARLEAEGAVADMLMNEEALLVVSNITQMTANFAVLSNALTNQGAAADLIMNDELKEAVVEAANASREIKNLLQSIEVAIAQDPANTNGLTAAVAALPDLKGIAELVRKQMEDNPNAVSNSVELLNSVSRLAATVEKTLDDPELTRQVSKLTADIDSMLDIFENHWLMRGAAATKAEQTEAAWAGAYAVVLKLGNVVESLRAAGGNPAAIRSIADELGVVGNEMATAAEQVIAVVSGKSVRADQLIEISTSLLQLNSNFQTNQSAAALSSPVAAFVERYEKSPIVREARDRAELIDAAAGKRGKARAGK